MGGKGESPLMHPYICNLRHCKFLDSMPYLVDLSPGIQAPDILFATPMLFEVYGGGFDKAPGCRVRVIPHRKYNAV